MLVGLGSIAFSKVLVSETSLSLGKVSYSFYLVHPVVLISIVHVLYERLSILLILIISFIVTLVASMLCYKFIENPSIELGRKLTGKNSKSLVRIEKEKLFKHKASFGDAIYFAPE